MTSSYRLPSGVRTAGRLLATAAALAAVAGAVIVANDGGHGSSGTLQDSLIAAGPTAGTGAAPTAAPATTLRDTAALDLEAAHEAAAIAASSSASAAAVASASAAASSSAVTARAAQAAVAARQQASAAARDAQRDPRDAARLMLASHGWGGGQFACLDALWTKESNWNYRAANAYSGAYGIAQALPGAKMASAGADWATNPVTQIAWGLSYIASTYGSPCAAWAHSQADNWY